MTAPFQLKSLGKCRQHWITAAEWSFAAWAHEFPADTVRTYLDQYAQVENSLTGMPEVVAAISPADELLGIATLVLDDELPGAIEPGPWLAAVYVAPPARRIGIGEAITMRVAAQAQMLGFRSLHLYTEDKRNWYESMGWRYSRSSSINGLPISVMELMLSVDCQFIYHLTTRGAWSTRSNNYSPASLESDGFIHCSTLHQLTNVANAFYKCAREVVVLVIDTSKLTSDVRWEPPSHPDGSPAEHVYLLYPHIYGEINTDAVVEIADMTRDSQGRFRFPPQFIGR